MNEEKEDPLMQSLGLGVDIGGTFTDVVLYDDKGVSRASHKELTTHDDPSRGVLVGMDTLLAAHAVDAGAIGRVIHATTLFTNALLERRGARTGLITTAGFRDVLEIGREDRYELYNLDYANPEPLVPRNLRREVPERMDRDGRVRVPLDVSALAAEAGELVALGVEALAVVFLHSYRNPAHELEAAKMLAEAWPALSVSCSYEVAPVIREYERTSSTVANAYVKPLATAYLDRLAAGMAQRGITAPIQMMLSSGGLTSLEDAKTCPIKVLEAGPAAGVIAATAFGADADTPELLAFDMGGTTAKLCVVEHGQPKTAQSFEAARQERFIKGSGLPILMSTIELIEIGAGGGSLASINDLGLLKVGPESAGSSPGPACYGLGGARATVTDANFHLGYLDPDCFAGGRIDIDMAAARCSLTALGEQAGLSATRAAWGIFDVVNEAMASAARVHISEQGLDPRKSVLVATGGGGPLHGFYVGKKIGVRRVLCPAGAGVASAIGLLCAPVRVERTLSVVKPYEMIDWDEIEQSLAALTGNAREILAGAGLANADVVFERQADLRFSGQASDVTVSLPDAVLTGLAPDLLRQRFLRSYRQRFAGAPESGRINLTNLRVIATLALDDRARPNGMRVVESAESGGEPRRREVYFPEFERHIDTTIYRRRDLQPGEVIQGPAVIEDPLSTVLVGPSAVFSITAAGHVQIEFIEQEEMQACTAP